MIRFFIKPFQSICVLFFKGTQHFFIFWRKFCGHIHNICLAICCIVVVNVAHKQTWSRNTQTMSKKEFCPQIFCSSLVCTWHCTLIYTYCSALLFNTIINAKLQCSKLLFSQGPFHGEPFAGKWQKQYIIPLTIQYAKYFETNFTMIVIMLYAIFV